MAQAGNFLGGAAWRVAPSYLFVQCRRRCGRGGGAEQGQGWGGGAEQGQGWGGGRSRGRGGGGAGVGGGGAPGKNLKIQPS